MRLPDNNDVNKRFFFDTTNALVHTNEGSVDGKATTKKRQWMTHKKIWAFGGGTDDWLFSMIVLPWRQKFVPFVWESGECWVRVGDRMTLEEAKAVCLMRDAMRNVVPLVNESQEEVVTT